ncbi:MAG: hypothetical protein WCW01_00930 [Gammaproteobacteria bacterium]
MNNVDHLLYRLHYNLLHFLPLNYYAKRYATLPRLDSKEKVIISFTTTPERIQYLDVMLKSLLSQSKRVDYIHLCLPKLYRDQEPYTIPPHLLQSDFLKIIRSEKDFGPATKLIPTLQMHDLPPDTKIVIVDDDQVYPRRHIERLNHWSNLYPESALGMAGCLIPPNQNPSQMLTVNSDSKDTHRISASICKDLTKSTILFGYAGYIVRPSFFDESFYDYSIAPKAAYFEDDVWVSGSLAKRGIKRYVIPLFGQRSIPASSRQTRTTRCLFTNENKGYKNMDEIFQYFSKYW